MAESAEKKDNKLNTSADSNSTFQSVNSTLNTSASISVSSESSLLIPGKLHADIQLLKNCYVDIISLFDVAKNAKSNQTQVGGQAILLNKDQLTAGVKKFKAPELKEHLANVLDHIRPVCLPSYQLDTRPKSIPQSHDLQIANLASKVEALCSENKAGYESLRADLSSFQSALSTFESSKISSVDSSPPYQPIAIFSEPYVIEHDIPCVVDSVEDFIPESDRSKLIAELSELPYSKEKGRLVMKFGEHYSYNGSRTDTTAEFPPSIKSILDTLNEKFGSDRVPPLNSCLITKYVGPSSYIPSHSDDERTIHPESNIVTVSLGKEATIKFTDKHDDSSHEHVARDGSMYIMSRRSQGHYKHRIDKNDQWAKSDQRISLTFRSVHWRNNNSTLIIGDSNTGGLKFANFGPDASSEYGGTFGNAMPGKRVEAYIVDELDAMKCIGYNNIVVHCGINDIRSTDVQTNAQVKDAYVNLKTKVDQIVQVNKRAQVYVSLLLPTKLDDCNIKVKYFNKLLTDDLCKSFSNNVRIISHSHRFCNSRGQLTKHLSRDINKNNEPDMLHLNEAGLRVLSMAIKNSIFIVKRERRDRGAGISGGSGGRPDGQRNSDDYAAAAASRSHEGGRGRTNRGRRGRTR